MSDEYYDENDQSGEYEDSFEEEAFDVDDELGRGPGFIRRNSPVLMISLALHLLAFLIISLIPGSRIVEEEEVLIVTEYIDKIEEEAPEEVEKIEIDTEDIEVETEVVEEQETEVEEAVEESFTESEEVDEAENMPAEEPVNDIIVAMPSVLGVTSNMAVSKMPSGYGNRFGKGKAKAMKRYGADGKTTKAVDMALRWLAEHQEPDGAWLATKYEGHNAEHFNATACAILPFLGAGHSENIGKYKRTVRSGIRMLNKLIETKSKNKQRPHFGNNYGSAIGLMTLSEASLFGSKAVTKRNADAIAKMFIDMHSKAPSGWHYHNGGNDFSVSGWVALGLKSAKAAGLKSLKTRDAKQVFATYKTWVDETMTSYETGMGKYNPGHGGSRNMTWVGMFQKQFLGFKKSDPFLTAAASKSVKDGWVNQTLSGDKITDAYAIYYGTLAAFQQQGKFWNAWNSKMKPYLVGTQHRGDPKKLGGSWDPGKDHTSKQGGRVMVTALIALCLEVYYRYDIMN